ncbi:hypothetical protein JCM10908_000781 [Rhodotorula pacifica]|uniref:uncharacterized protein n=1 Tax=Rhodotorula pacifica TaxID=1495444 RepID=UPI003179AFC6
MTASTLLEESLELLVSISDDLAPCGPAVLHLVSRLSDSCHSGLEDRIRLREATHLSETLRQLADEKLNSFPYHAVPTRWRRLYTDAVLYGAVAALRARESAVEQGEQETREALLQAIGRLDLAIVIAGTPGPMRHELALSLIALAQKRLAAGLGSPALPAAAEVATFERPAKRPRTRRSSEADSTTTAGSWTPASSSYPPRLAPAPAPYMDLPLTELPSLPTFLDPAHNPSYRQPFIVRRGAVHFPAFSTTTTTTTATAKTENARPRSRWSDSEYLRRIAGEGRVVPVEVGGDYTKEEWGQRMMPFAEFLDSLAAVDAARGGINANGVEDDAPTAEQDASASCSSTPPPLYYLAQHSLFRQFPFLLSDLLIPDLVYSPPEHHSSSDPYSTSGSAAAEPRVYESPQTEEGYVLNAWLGPRGTKSAAHTDPWWNCYVQMAGSKWIWVAPPECGPYMSAFGGETTTSTDPPEGDDSRAKTTADATPATGPANSQEGKTTAEEYMTNTSSLDVTVPPPPSSATKPTPYPPEFLEHVRPHARQGVLEEGDVLVMPPGWWHAMVGLETSFSVSMWF